LNHSCQLLPPSKAGAHTRGPHVISTTLSRRLGARATVAAHSFSHACGVAMERVEIVLPSGRSVEGVEIVLPDGSVAEVDGITEFTSKVDQLEDRVNDGNRYKGLLTKDDYDKRKKKLNDKLRQEADPEGYRREKLEEAINKEKSIEREAAVARRVREEDRKKKLAADLKAGGGVVKKKGKKDKQRAMLSFEEVDE